MDVWNFPVCFGVLNLIPCLYCTIFQAHSSVIWPEADKACRQCNGTLFKPDEKSFDVSPFPNNTFDGDSWVAASYAIVMDPEIYFTNFRMNNSYRCIAVEIQENCAVRYWHKACSERYGMIFELNGDLQLLYENEIDWNAANNVCRKYHLKLATFINREILVSRGPCKYGFYWTGRVIEVMFQSTRSNQRRSNCGILQNDVLSFDDWFRMLRPLCERAERSTTRSPNSYHRTGTDVIVSVFKNSTTTSNRTKSGTTVRVPTSTTIEQCAIFEMTSQRSNTNNGLIGGVKEDNIYSSLPSVTNMEKGIVTTSSSDRKSKPPDIGAIIGSVLGGIVFSLLMVLLVIILRKRLTHGTRMSDSTKQAERTKCPTGNNAMNPAYSVYNQDVVLQTGLNNETYVSYASDPEQRNRGMMAETSKPNKYVHSLAASDANIANYAKVKKLKAVQKVSNHSPNVIYEDSDQFNDNKMGNENVNGNVYDKTNFRLRDCLVDQSDSVYDTTNEFRRALVQSDGVYDKANNGRFDEYDTTHVTKRVTDFTYDHV